MTDNATIYVQKVSIFVIVENSCFSLFPEKNVFIIPKKWEPEFPPQIFSPVNKLSNHKKF
jgi:hypothetical protein